MHAAAAALGSHGRNDTEGDDEYPLLAKGADGAAVELNGFVYTVRQIMKTYRLPELAALEVFGQRLGSAEGHWQLYQRKHRSFAEPVSDKRDWNVPPGQCTETDLRAAMRQLSAEMVQLNAEGTTPRREILVEVISEATWDRLKGLDYIAEAPFGHAYLTTTGIEAMGWINDHDDGSVSAFRRDAAATAASANIIGNQGALKLFLARARDEGLSALTCEEPSFWEHASGHHLVGRLALTTADVQRLFPMACALAPVADAAGDVTQMMLRLKALRGESPRKRPKWTDEMKDLLQRVLEQLYLNKAIGEAHQWVAKGLGLSEFRIKQIESDRKKGAPRGIGLGRRA